MSAPFIWIFVPALASVILLALNKYRRATLGIGATILAGLAALAYRLPIGETISLGPISFRISDTLTVLGRRFILGADDRYLLVMIYLLAAFWFTGALTANVHPWFAALALAMVAFFVAALAVEPFLYAALLIEMAVLVSIPMLAPPGKQVQPGVLRYLIFQTLAMPFILFTGWMLTGLEAGSSDPGLILRAGVMLGLGFAFLLSIFPFYSWIPLVGEQNHPYVVGFILLMQPAIVLLFGVDFLNQYTWLRDNPAVFDLLRLSGVIMVVTGGAWAAFQRHLGRMFGYAAIMETGFSLLAIGLGIHTGLPILAMLFLPRVLGLAAWSLSLTLLLERVGTLDIRRLAGFGRQDPVLAGSLVVAQLSMLGLPLFASFPPRLALLQHLAQENLALTVWVVFGIVGLLAATIRATVVLFVGEGWRIELRTPWSRYLLMVIALLVIVLAGIQPQWFLPVFSRITQAYTNLIP